MPWRPLPRIAFAVAIYPFQPSTPADLPLELGDELYIIEQGGVDGEWCRGYLVAPPSLLAGLTSTKGQTLEARVFSGIFPRNCVEIREVLGDNDGSKAMLNGDRRSADKATNFEGDQGSVAYSQDDEQPGGEVLDVMVAKKKKPSQVFIHKLDDESRGAVSPRPPSAWRPGSVPPTPVTPVSHRDPDAPKPPAPVPMLKVGDETPTSLSEPLVDEIASCLREWHSTNLHELLLARQYDVVEEMSNVVLELDFARRQLLHNVLTSREKEALRDEVVWKLVRSNKMLGGEVIARDPQQRGRLLTGEDSAIELAKLQSEMSMLESPPSQQTDATALHHLLLEVNAVSGKAPGPVTLAVYLCSKSETSALKPLSETYVLDIPSPEKFSSSSQSSKLKTLFTELSSSDIGDGSANAAQLYLVIAVRAPEATSTSNSAQPSLSREGSSAGKTPQAINQTGKGSVRTRRSMVWTPKPRGPSTEPSKENSKNPPQSSDSSASSKDRTDAQPAKDPTSVRTIGLGLLEVSQILRQDKSTEQVVHILSPPSGLEEAEAHSDGFDALMRTLLPSANGTYVRSARAGRLHLHLHPFASPDADTLIRNNPTVMHNVAQTKKIGFSQAPAKPRSDIYVTLSQAVFAPDALLSHPTAGQVPVPTNSQLQNLQLTLEVRSSSGTRIDRCIFPSSNSAAQTAWRTTIAKRGSPWNQTIRLNIPAEQIPGSHLIMSVADAPEFPFALAWMPLWDQHAFMRDGRHSLLLHAYDKTTSSIENGKGAYLSLPWSSLGKNESAKDEAVTGPLATLQLDTSLSSTEYSQDQVILSLLNWREKPVDETLNMLRRVLFVPEIEIVKQLSGVLDALFGILVENAGSEEYEDLIFRDLVTVLGIVHDRRFNLGPLVDHYAENQFNFPFATPCLIRSYLRLLQASGDAQQSRNLRSTFKVGRHVLKFIINARQQQKAKEEGIGITRVQSTFNRDLHAIFKSLEDLMKNPSPAMVGSKTLVVQHFHTWLPELSKVLSKDEVIMIAFSFMDSCRDVTGLLILYKLVLIQHYTQLEMFSEGPERQNLIASCISWLAPYWGSPAGVSDQYRDQVRLCSAIVAQLLKQPDSYLYQFMPSIVSSYCAISVEGVDDTEYLSLLFSKSFPFQVKTSKTYQRFDESLIELSALMAAIGKVPKPKRPKLKEDDLVTFISQAIEAHNSILNCEAYPESWLSIHIYNHRAAVKSLEYLASILIDKCLPSPDDADAFDTRLWGSFFTTLLKVVSSDALALETFPEQKRRAIWKIAGDVRELGAALLHAAWDSIGWDTTDEERERYGLERLGGYQVQYVPSLVTPIIELCLSVHEGLRHVAVDILRTMVLSEWDLNRDLSIIEAEIITSLDSLIKKKHMNESIIQKLFVGDLLAHFEGCSEFDEELSNAVNALIATVDELLELLVAAQGGTEMESLHTLKLMEYMKDLGREDIFIRYVHELSQVQAAAGEFAEAGLTLQFHADLYHWDTTKPVPELVGPAFPEQSSFERKESLYFSIIQHFEDARAWAHALACYKELAHQYEDTIIDFAKLSRTQGSMARIYELIAKEDKQFPRYFRVFYRGLGFPATLRDKEYVFEGSPFERMASFIDRMQREHPAAQIVSSGDIQDYEGQFLQISSVNAHRDMAHPVYQRSKVPLSVREHLLVSEPCCFTSTLKRHTGSPNVKDQWVEKAVFTTAESFPNILRRSEIVGIEEVSLTPLQTALERTWRKTQELSLLEKRAAMGEDPSLSNLTEALEQLLDLTSHSPSCVGMYRQFLSKDDEAADDETVNENEAAEEAPKPVDPMENALAVALIDHALAIKHALSLYARPAHLATRSELLRRFEGAFAPEIESLASAAYDSPQLPEPPSSEGGKQQAPLRPTSPEQELIQSSRQGVNRKPSEKHTVTHRISIMNPFKRASHGRSNSAAVMHGAVDQPVNGATSESGRTRDDETGTIHTRNSSRSRKRRSWFGGDRASKHRSSLSFAGGTSTEDINRRGSTRSAASRDTTRRSRVSRSRSRSRHNTHTALTGQDQSSVTNPNGGGWTRTPSVKDQQRPVTGQSKATSSKDVQATNTSQAPEGASGGSSGVRDSVRKRFSLLKGVGRKGSRLDFKPGTNGMTVHEE
jgi:dedicator of cytokinesis protein 3